MRDRGTNQSVTVLDIAGSRVDHQSRFSMNFVTCGLDTPFP